MLLQYFIVNKQSAAKFTQLSHSDCQNELPQIHCHYREYEHTSWVFKSKWATTAHSYSITPYHTYINE